MIVDERIVTFINSLDTENSRILEEIEKEAHASDVPVIRREMQSLLKVLLMLQKPMRILEVGTAIGFSALLMSEYAPEGCRITTIENYEKRIPIARENFARAGKEDAITLIEGDAAEVLGELEGTYDFIFMDAAKGQYIHYLPHVFRLLLLGHLGKGRLSLHEPAHQRSGEGLHDGGKERLFAGKITVKGAGGDTGLLHNLP